MSNQEETKENGNAVFVVPNAGNILKAKQYYENGEPI